MPRCYQVVRLVQLKEAQMTPRCQKLQVSQVAWALEKQGSSQVGEAQLGKMQRAGCRLELKTMRARVCMGDTRILLVSPVS